MEIRLSGSQQIFLDKYRIIAAYFVLVGHSFSYYQMTIFKDQQYFPYIQNIGVVMFFLLSGFLTTYSLNNKNKNGDYEFEMFAKHKAARIMKEYLPGLLLIALIDYMAIRINGSGYSYYQAYNIKQFLGNLFMLQGTLVKHIPHMDIIPFGSGRPLWTLSVEWWLYMLFGFLFLAIVNRRKIGLKRAALLGVLLSIPSAYLIGGRGGGLGVVFGLGILSYYCYERIERNAALPILVFSFIAYILYGIIFKEAYTIYSYIIIWIIFFAKLKLVGVQTTERSSAFAFVSQSTFMLYLTHYSIIDMICRTTYLTSIAFKFILGIVLAIVVSFVMYFIFGREIRVC